MRLRMRLKKARGLPRPLDDPVVPGAGLGIPRGPKPERAIAGLGAWPTSDGRL